MSSLQERWNLTESVFVLSSVQEILDARYMLVKLFLLFLFFYYSFYYTGRLARAWG